MLNSISKSIIIIFALLALGGYETYACMVHGDCWHGCCGKKKLDLKIDYAGYYNKQADGEPNAGIWPAKDLRCEDFFHFRDIKPGDFGEGTISLHLKGRDAWSCAFIRPTKNDDRRSTEPELLEDEPDEWHDKWDGELAQNLNFRIWADICDEDQAEIGDNVFQPGCDRLLTEGTGPLQTLNFALADSANNNVFSDLVEPLAKNSLNYLGVEWNIAKDVGNLVQTDVYKADVEFFAVQASGNDWFRCSQLDPGNPRRCVDGAERQCYSGPSGTMDVGICKSGNQTCHHGKWGHCQGQVTPKKELCGDGLDNDCDGQVDERSCHRPGCKRTWYGRYKCK